LQAASASVRAGTELPPPARKNLDLAASIVAYTLPPLWEPEAMESASVVHLEEARKTYRLGRVEVPALRGVTVAVRPQSFTVIAGPSGCGKTTLLNLVGCIDRPDGGEVTVCGEPVTTWDDHRLADFRARTIGFVFQSFNLIPVLSAYENVEYPLRLLGVGARERRSRTLAMLESVGLAEQQGRRPNELSGGQRQRVAIARALVKQPVLVLADEPTANLDQRTGQAIIALMRTLQEQCRTTLIFSSHDPHLIGQADEVVRLCDGAVVDV